MSFHKPINYIQFILQHIFLFEHFTENVSNGTYCVTKNYTYNQHNYNIK